MRRSHAAILIALLLAVAGCRGSGNSPRAAAERFLDDHYVHINLEAAKRHTVGVARTKVEEEQRLVEGQEIDASTRRPRVGYSFVEERDKTDDRVALLYDATVHIDDGGTVNVRWLVTVRRETDGVWKVSNYQEFE